MSIIFTGYYGNLNTGDDAFCVVSNWAAIKFWEQQKVRFFGRDLPIGHDGKPLNSSILQNHLLKGQDYLEMLAQGLIHNFIVFSGGSLFHSELRGFTKESVFKVSTNLGMTKLGGIGVSIGPYKTNRARSSIMSFLSKFSFLALRDRRSYEEAQNMQLPFPVIEAFDLAALLPSIYPLQKDVNVNPILGISICPYERFSGENIENEYNRYRKVQKCIEILKGMIPELFVRIMVFNGHPHFGDYVISDQLISQLKDSSNVELIDYNRNPLFMWNAISGCDVVLSTRLHAGIFACFSETPFIQIEYHKKCGDFLNGINYPEQLRIGDFEVSELELANKLASIIGEKPSLIKDLESLKQKAILNFTSFQQHFKKTY